MVFTMSMKSWLSFFGNAARRPMARSRQRVPLCVEALEDRTLLSANLIVSSAGVFPQFNLVNPGSGGRRFGTKVVCCAGTGNIVVTDPTVNNDAGAVYLFNGQSGALISTLTGSTGGANGDMVGSGGVTALSNGNFVVDSPGLERRATNGMKAVTWGATWSAATAPARRQLRRGTALIGNGGATNGMGASAWGQRHDGRRCRPYRPQWSRRAGGRDGASDARPAAAPGHRAHAVARAAVPIGAVHDEIAVAGAVAADRIARSGADEAVGGAATAPATATSSSPAPIGTAGATNGMGRGHLGQRARRASRWRFVAAANSLIGSTAGDTVGSGGITFLSGNAGGNFVVDSPSWSGGKGAVTWGEGTTGVAGTISAANSLVGSNAGDKVGSGGVTGGGVTALSNGSYGA